jgi:hypothetical protein
MWRLWTRGWGPRYWWLWFRHEGLPFWLARRLPRSVAYWAFIRVHAAGEVDWTFNEVAKNWHSGSGK